MQACGHGVQLPGVGLEIHAAERRSCVDIGERIVFAAQGADFREGLGHGGRRVALAQRNELRADLLDRGLDLFGSEDRSPLRFEGRDLRATTGGDLDQQVAEAAEDRHEDLVAGLDQRHQRGFDCGTGGAIDQHGPAVLRLEHAAVERRSLGHEVAELRVELAEELGRHSPQHARVGVDRAGPHQQPGQGVEFGNAGRGHTGLAS